MTSLANQPGDFAVVCEPASPVEKMQVLIRGSKPRYRKYVHAIMLTSVTPVEIVEAMPGGAVRVPMHYSDASLFWSAAEIQPSPQQRTAIVAAANGYAARKAGYSFLDYLAIADHSWGIPFPGLQAFIEDTGHVICSQLVDACEFAGGVHLFTDERWAGYVAPLDLAERISAP